LDNAHLLAHRGEREKAGEMLWGAVVLSTKALAILRNIRLKGGSVSGFVADISKVIGAPDLRAQFHLVEGMHGRFYEAAPEGIDINYVVAQAQAFTGRVLELVDGQLRRAE
jgi:hypothetical protein